MPVVATPTPQAPANPLFVKPGDSILDYETRLGQTQGGTGTGFGTPQPIAPALVAQSTGQAPTPTAPTAPTTDPNSLDSLAKSLGYDSYSDALGKLTAPSADTTSFYNQAYSAAGLDALSNQISSRQNDLNTATGNINDNPWLDEASRVGRTRNLTTLAEGDIKNLQDEYNTKLNHVHDLVTQHSADLNQTDASNKAKLSFLEAQAKAIADQQATATKAATTAANTPPKTIKAANGATFQWNPTTGQFQQILPGNPPKNPTPASPKGPTKDDISSVASEFDSVKGSDGFIDPKDWQTMLNAWVKNGYSSASFITNFKSFANPYDTYVGITPKKATSSGGRTL